MKHLLLFENYMNTNFWNWFKDSKIIDKNGNPLVVYHGSSEYFTEFNCPTFFTDDYFNAEGYSGDGYVYDVYLSIKNPLIVDCKGSMYNNIKSIYGSSTTEIVQNIDENIYDGVIFENVKDNWIDDEDYQEPTTIYVALYPYQIKSAEDNNGNFSKSFNINENTSSENTYPDVLRKEMIKYFLKNVEEDNDYNTDDVEYDMLLDPHMGYDYQTYIQNIIPNKEFILYEGFSSYCWKAFMKQPRYKGLNKIQIIEKFIKERAVFLGEDFGYNLKDYTIDYIDTDEYSDYFISLIYSK